MFSKIDHVSIVVDVMEDSVAYYTQLLGFQIEEKRPTATYLKAGEGFSVVLVAKADFEGIVPDQQHVSFYTDDFDATYEKLRHSIWFEGEPRQFVGGPRDGLRHVNWRDPNGVYLEIIGK
ncbi:MAG: VOC family protein [Gemmatimonadetes bacterium]|nr:MAG: VOC family protein [Gemmatimonadota bacterium]